MKSVSKNPDISHQLLSGNKASAPEYPDVNLMLCRINLNPGLMPPIIKEAEIKTSTNEIKTCCIKRLWFLYLK